MKNLDEIRRDLVDLAAVAIRHALSSMSPAGPLIPFVMTEKGINRFPCDTTQREWMRQFNLSKMIKMISSLRFSYTRAI